MEFRMEPETEGLSAGSGESTESAEVSTGAGVESTAQETGQSEQKSAREIELEALVEKAIVERDRNAATLQRIQQGKYGKEGNPANIKEPEEETPAKTGEDPALKGLKRDESDDTYLYHGEWHTAAFIKRDIARDAEIENSRTWRENRELEEAQSKHDQSIAEIFQNTSEFAMERVTKKLSAYLDADDLRDEHAEVCDVVQGRIIAATVQGQSLSVKQISQMVNEAVDKRSTRMAKMGVKQIQDNQDYLKQFGGLSSDGKPVVPGGKIDLSKMSTSKQNDLFDEIIRRGEQKIAASKGR